MPFINVKTNVSVSKEKEVAVKSALGEAITAIPGKSEGWLMVGFEPEYRLYFKGSDEPATMVEVSIYGNASSSALDTFTGKVDDILERELSLSPSRIYVKYVQTPDWGWNGGNF
ncbi:MAG: phenylpyruvate tautomerase MIF-related protein [Bacteroides sp.]|nr:phenylpyruvate tautomerase MIF-related protein [Eubacterium sp.]MCM1417171.1 phenylpyruvate tautomerase MIF-related protein [Roseburia sp.]MCM1461208.1 phenylpyruvate tautomerase MIF-related protein [Bacteroides sp.]